MAAFLFGLLCAPLLRNLKTRSMSIGNLLNSSTKSRTVVELSIEDLRTVVGDVLREERQKAAEEAKRGNTPDLLSRREVCRLLNVGLSTLWRWEQSGYLIPVKTGRKCHYLKKDIDNLISK